MSLINEALKRAEEDKLRNAGVSAALPPGMSPVPAEAQPSVSKRRLPPRVVLLLVAAMIASAAWLAFSTLSSKPASATASQRTNAQPFAKAAITASMPANQPASVPASAQADISSLKPLTQSQPKQDQSATMSKVGQGLAAAFGIVAKLNGISVPSRDSGAIARPQAQPAAKAPAPPAPATKPLAKAAAQPFKPVDMSKFALSGVVQGPNGGTAIINGKYARAGQVVDGAKVVRITGDVVELELEGQRFTLGM